MKTNLPIFLVLLFLGFACKKAEIRHPVLDCIGEVDTPLIATSLCLEENFPVSICEAESFGEVLLEEDSKIFMPQYCSSIGDYFIFKNESGEEKVYELTQKKYAPFSIMYNTLNPCPNDPDKYKGICLSTDHLKLTLDELDGYSQFILRINTGLNRNFDGTYGDFLTISNKIDSTTWSANFEIVINQRSLDHDAEDYQEIFPEINLNGVNYKEVLSYDISKLTGQNYKFYYTKEQGLIGFKDFDEIIWTLLE